MSTTAERFALLKEKLEKAREENLKAVEDESRKVAQATLTASENEHLHDTQTVQPNRSPKRARTEEAPADVGSADEADGEDEDDGIRSMKRRARKVQRGLSPTSNEDRQDGVVFYGGAGDAISTQNADRMVRELQDVEKRRANFRRRRAFNEDRSDINFINEGNRLFNRTLDRHFDKFDSVKKIKDSLERGTA